MGNATASAKRVLSREDDHRLLMLGLDGAGKTSILYRIKLNHPVTTLPTIGFQVETVEYKNFNFTVWDVGGQDKIRPLWAHYMQNVGALLWVMDAHDADRLDENKHELSRMLFAEFESALKTVPVLIFANKYDLPDCMNIDHIARSLFDFKSQTDPVQILSTKYDLQDCEDINIVIAIITQQCGAMMGDDEVNITMELCQLIISFVPCQAMIGKLGERDFCILPTSATAADGMLSSSIFKGLEWLETILNPEKECLIM